MTQCLATEVVTCETFGLLLTECTKGLLRGYKNINGGRANMIYL